MATKALVKQETAEIERAYDMALSPEAVARLREIGEELVVLRNLTDEARAVRITDDRTDVEAAALVVSIAKSKKKLEELRTYFGKPFGDRKKAVDESFKGWTAAALEQDARLRKEAGDWFMQKREAAAAEERRRLAEDADRQKKARQLGMGAPKTVVREEIQEPAKSVATDAGTRSISLVADFEVVEFAKVSDAFKSVDAVAVREAVGGIAKEQLEAIHDGRAPQPYPGLRVFLKPRSSAR